MAKASLSRTCIRFRLRYNTGDLLHCMSRLGRSSLQSFAFGRGWHGRAKPLSRADTRDMRPVKRTLDTGIHFLALKLLSSDTLDPYIIRKALNGCRCRGLPLQSWNSSKFAQSLGCLLDPLTFQRVQIHLIVCLDKEERGLVAPATGYWLSTRLDRYYTTPENSRDCST